MADERDPKVSQRYRELSGEEPSRELDQAILAAAHRSVDKPHAPLVVPAGRHRWYFSLAAAAILVLAVAVTLHVDRQQPDAELAESTPASPTPQLQKVEPRRETYSADPAPAAPAAPAPKALARIQAESAAGARADAEKARAEAEAAAAAAERARLAAEQARLSAEKAAAESVAADAAAARSKQRAASDVAASRPAPAAAPMLQSAARTPEQELERIAELRRQGRHEEADKALVDFVQRYPNYQISPQMRAKVQGRSVPAR